MVSEHGKIEKEAQAASEPEALTRLMRDVDGTIAVVGLEAGPLSQWLHRGLNRMWVEDADFRADGPAQRVV